MVSLNIRTRICARAGQKMWTLRKTQNEKRFRKRKIRRKEGIEKEGIERDS